MSEQTRLSAISICRQQSTGGYVFGRGTTYPGTFEATDTGSATTIVSATLGAFASANSDFVGMLVEAVSVAAGPSGEGGAPLRRKIMSYVHSTTTLTVEAFPFATADEDTFRLLDDPGVVFADDTGGSQTAVIDTDVSMTADAINGDAAMGGPYMVALAADNVTVGTQRLISDYATDTATVASLGASTAVGDLFEAHQWLEVFGESLMKLSQPRVDRASMTGTFGMLRGVAGVREATGSLELAFRGPGSARVGEPGELDNLLGSVMTAAAAPTDENVSSGSSTSSINVDSAGNAGEMWCTESGDVCVDTTGADPMVPSPSLRVAPASGETLFGMRKFTPAEAANYALKIVQFRGRGWKDEIVGVLPALKFSGARGEFFTLSADLVGADGYSVYLDESGTAISRPSGLDPKLPTVVPKARDDIRVNIDGVEFEARSVSGDMGFVIETEINMAAPNQATVVYRGDAVTGQTDLYLDTDAKLLAVKALEGKAMRMLIQVGTSPGFPGVFALWLNEVEVTGVDFGDDAGAQTATVQWRCTYDSTSTLARWIMGTG